MNLAVLNTTPELMWVWSACIFNFIAAGVMLFNPKEWQGPVMLITTGVVLFAIAIVIRWTYLGHGPFISLFEILLSNLFGLGLIHCLFCWRMPKTRVITPVVLPVLILLSVWIVFVPASGTHLPATYNTPWLWVHVLMGKLFLGMALMALGFAGVILFQYHQHDLSVKQEVTLATLDLQIYRWLSLGLVFHSLMLVSGAVWAQDAWGRYWAWDPLEISSFLTWLALGLALHLRITWRIPAKVNAMMAVTVFVLAFLTFFGLPFLSQAPHQGAI